MINNNEPLTNTATGGGGAQVINHGTVGLADNRLLSVTGDNDVSRVARSNTATGGDTLPISNEMRSWTDNRLPSSNGDNDVSLEARGNTNISQKKGKCQRFANGQKEDVVSLHRLIQRDFVVNITLHGYLYKRGAAVHQQLIMRLLV